MILVRGSKSRYAWKWRRGLIFLLLIPSLLLAGCGAGGTSEPEAQLSPPATEQGEVSMSVLPTATRPLPADTPALPTKTPIPPTETPASFIESPPLQLVLLHTNDNWGETEPCG